MGVAFDSDSGNRGISFAYSNRNDEVKWVLRGLVTLPNFFSTKKSKVCFSEFHGKHDKAAFSEQSEFNMFVEYLFFINT
jgi:hypothetical protein